MHDLRKSLFLSIAEMIEQMSQSISTWIKWFGDPTRQQRQMWRDDFCTPVWYIYEVARSGRGGATPSLRSAQAHREGVAGYLPEMRRRDLSRAGSQSTHC